MISVFPGLLYMSCAAFLAFYRLDAPTCRRMERELEARRAEGPAQEETAAQRTPDQQGDVT
jgi:Na+/melibiose symporter-like transporter